MKFQTNQLYHEFIEGDSKRVLTRTYDTATLRRRKVKKPSFTAAQLYWIRKQKRVHQIRRFIES